jgi:hypothetical protein
MIMRYLLLRYISDLARNEPRNIGVVLACEQGVVAKFLGEKDGRLDLRAVRALASHSGTYRQWIDYWRYIIGQVDPPTQRLDQILASSNGNYVAVEGEQVYLPQDVAANPLSALRHLYYFLVDEFPREEEPDADLNARCDEIIRQFELRKSPHFQESPIIDVRLSSTLTQQIIPSFSWVNGVEIYFQKVSLIRTRPETTRKNVNSAAWIFERLKEDKPDRKAKALLKISGDIEADGNFTRFDPKEYLAVLTKLADDVIDVDDANSIERAFAPLAGH